MRALEFLVNALTRVNAPLLVACRGLTVALVAAIAVVVCAGVFWRYVLNDALAWSEETAKFLMVWLVFVAAPVALARGGHASIDALPAALPPRVAQALYVLIYALVLCFLAVLVDQGWGFALNARVQTTPTTGVSMMYVFASMPAGGVLMALVSLELLARALVGIADPSRGVHLPEHEQAGFSPE